MCDAAERAAIAGSRVALVTQLLGVPLPTGSAEGAIKGEAPSVLVPEVWENPQQRWALSQFRGRMAHSMATRRGVVLST